jgi:uncharacterized protein YhfF
MWEEFIAKHPEYQNKPEPESYYFCDNKKDADECAELVLKGIKQATTTSLWWFKQYKAPLPKTGDLAIVTNWAGEAMAVIKTVNIVQIPFNQISEDYAHLEGEGDRSLGYWKKVHWAYYAREMEPHGEKPSEDMILVCEQFKMIWS